MDPRDTGELEWANLASNWMKMRKIQNDSQAHHDECRGQ